MEARLVVVMAPVERGPVEVAARALEVAARVVGQRARAEMARVAVAARAT